MSLGEKALLTIPASLAYGHAGNLGVVQVVLSPLRSVVNQVKSNKKLTYPRDHTFSEGSLGCFKNVKYLQKVFGSLGITIYDFFRLG